MSHTKQKSDDTNLTWWEKKSGKKSRTSDTAQKQAGSSQPADKSRAGAASRTANTSGTDRASYSKTDPASRTAAAPRTASSSRTGASSRTADKFRTASSSRADAPHFSSHSRNVISQTPMFDAKRIPRDAADILAHFDDSIASVRPLSAKQRVLLSGAIRDLSHELTDERGIRRVGYMNEVSYLSAYINYFMWWNLVRLVRLFANLPKDAFELEDGDVALDAGSGPLTVPIALWLARPELRAKKITWYCLDLSQNALADGEELYLSIAARTIANGEPWKIVRVKGALRGESKRDEGASIKEKAALVTCANVFNELVQTSEMPPDYLAKKYCESLLSYTRSEKKQTVLVIEPGFPKAARFVSLMRDALIRREFIPLSPCPHCESCPMDGKRGGKWCNFAFSTDDAPSALQKLSEKAGLPKERAVLSYILARRDTESKAKSQSENKSNVPAESSASEQHASPQNRFMMRITSDIIHLTEEHKVGFYACTQKGLALAVDTSHIELANGDLLAIKQPKEDEQLERDAKSGAVKIDI